MSIKKTIICLGKTRMLNGRGLVAKEMSEDKTWKWVRPVMHGDEIFEIDMLVYEDGSAVELLDIISVEFEEHVPSEYRKEDIEIRHGSVWERKGSFKYEEIAVLIDEPEHLWESGYSSGIKLNDRVPISLSNENSVYLISLDNMEIIVKYRETGAVFKKIVMARFVYNRVEHFLDVADPFIEEEFYEMPVGTYSIKEPKAVVSLGLPFRGFRYKTIASILYEDRFKK